MPRKSWDLSSVAGSSALVRFRYQTDGGLHYKGPFIDDISITAGGANLLTADVESDDNGWTAKGFTRMTGSTTVQSSHFYIAENRVYSGSCGTPTAPTRTTTRAATGVEARPCPSTLAPRRSPFATRRDWATAGRSSTPPSASRRPMRSRSTRTVI